MRVQRCIAAASILFLSLFLGVTLAQGQDHDDHGHGNNDNHNQGNYDDHDHGHFDDHARVHDHFDDHDRQAARDWYRGHHDYFRQDEGRYWRRDWEPNIREGFVLTPDMRRGIRPVPGDFAHRLSPPPPGYRYVIIGDHVCLIDHDYRIHDEFHFELNF